MRDEADRWRKSGEAIGTALGRILRLVGTIGGVWFLVDRIASLIF